MGKGKISVETENIFPIIKKFLYSDQEIFLRELVSNAIDATSKIKTLASKGIFKGELGDLTINISVNKDEKTLTISDRGIGMTEDETKKYLNQVAFSGAEDFVKKYKDEANIIGHFGLGFYSAFMVADKVEVYTKSYKDEDAVIWSCEGNPDYEIKKSKKENRGSDVVLHISEDATEFLEENKIQELLDKYCKFLPIEIKFGTKTKTHYEGEGDDKEKIETEIDNIINNPNPLWKKTPNDITDDEYKSFYRELYPLGQPPLFWIHLNIDYPFNLTGILYFPKLSNSVDIQKNKIQLYSNQVFITDDVSNIVPEFLTLLNGVIDSPDIPLNVSRSYLQSDSNVKKISSYITKKVSEKLTSLFKNNRKEYEEKWDKISTFTKYGMISDEKFYDKALKFALLKNIDGSYFTLEEYKDKTKDTQTDKHKKIVYLYADNIKGQHSYIRSVKDLGYDILEFDNIIDNHFKQHLEYKLGDVTFVRVDSDIPSNLIQKDDENTSIMTDKEIEKVKSIFTDSLDNLEGGMIDTKALSPKDHPVLITRPEFMRRMKEMQTLNGTDLSGFPDSYNVVINTNHPLIAEKLVNMRSADKKNAFAKYLHNLALLNQNMLKGEDLSLFIEKSIEFLN